MILILGFTVYEYKSECKYIHGYEILNLAKNIYILLLNIIYILKINTLSVFKILRCCI